MLRKTLFLGTAIAIGSMTQATPTGAAYFSNAGVYPCEVGYYPKTVPPTVPVILLTPTNGDYGRVTASFYTSPYCAGSFVRLTHTYSQGSNVLSWTEEDTYEPYGEAALLSTRAGLQRAADEGARATISGVSYPGALVGTTYYQLHSFLVRPN